jgi:hypothetical protein
MKQTTRLPSLTAQASKLGANGAVNIIDRTPMGVGWDKGVIFPTIKNNYISNFNFSQTSSKTFYETQSHSFNKHKS